MPSCRILYVTTCSKLLHSIASVFQVLDGHTKYSFVDFSENPKVRCVESKTKMSQLLIFGIIFAISA